jgi:glucose-1-phosphate adenylyltransferase
MDIIDGYRADYVIVLAGDHIYKMNYAVMLADHVRQGPRCHGGLLRGAARGRARLRRHGHRRAQPHHRLRRESRPIRRHAGRPDMALASMGIYIFNAAYLPRSSSATSPIPSPTTTSARTSSPTRCATAARWHIRSA